MGALGSGEHAAPMAAPRHRRLGVGAHVLACVWGAGVAVALALAARALPGPPIIVAAGLLGAGVACVLALAFGRMRRDSLVDPLSGVWNRRYLERRLCEERARAERRGTELAFLLVDLDHFKRVNDRFGHQAGDRALCAVAQVLEGSCRQGDIVARVGGDEFAVLAPDTAEEQALALAERLRLAVNRIDLGPSALRGVAANLMAGPAAVRGLGASLTVSASVGVATLGTRVRTLRALVACADRALHRSKKAGRDRVSLNPFGRR